MKSWNLLDFIIYVTLIAWLIVAIVVSFGDVNTATIDNFMIVSYYSYWMRVYVSTITVLVILRCLFLIRVNSKYGPVIISIAYMSIDVLRFLLFSFIILFGFTIFFLGVLSNYDPTYANSVTAGFTLFKALSAGLSFEPGQNINISTRVANLVVILHFIAMPLIMWNILISIMGSTFSKYKEDAEKEHRYIIAETCVRYQSFLFLPVITIFTAIITPLFACCGMNIFDYDCKDFELYNIMIQHFKDEHIKDSTFWDRHKTWTLPVKKKEEEED